MQTKVYGLHNKLQGNEPKVGELQVWHIPQIPGKPFTVKVDSIKEAKELLDVLAAYDLFQFKNNIKPDYSNMGGLNVYVIDSDGEGNPGWNTWYSDEGYELDEVDNDGNLLPEEGE